MQAVKPLISRAEYLRLEATATHKHEYYAGEMFAMAGGSYQHSRIATNGLVALAEHLHHTSCQPMNSDMRVSTPSGLDTYPDISVYCNEPALTDNGHTLLNPVMIIEVLSASTRSYDRGDKFMHYRTLPSLQDYLLVDSESVLVEHYQRSGVAVWQLREYRELTAEIVVTSLNMTLAVAAFYAGIDF